MQHIEIEHQLRQQLERAQHEEAQQEREANRRGPIGTSEGLLYADLSHAIVGAAIEVHRHLGPGQLESTYQHALEAELALRDIAFRAQVPVAALYKGREVGTFYADLVVEDRVLLELKGVAQVLPVHRAQVLSYLHGTGLRLGVLINFHVPVLWRGVKRIVL
jgi:GxxExxY protein